jgi:primosomal protein N'
MTQILEFLCKSCNKRYGTFGVQLGSSVVVCRACKDFMVVRKDSERCPQCKGACEPFDSACPSCGSKDLYFRDLSFPEQVRTWMKCKRP